MGAPGSISPRPAPSGRRLAAAGLAAALVWLGAVSLHDLCSNDVWIHLAAGRYIVRTRAVPRVDPFSYGTGEGRPWLDHEWFAQVVSYAAFRAAGARGVLALQTALALLAGLAGAALVRRRVGLAWAGAAPALFALIAYPRFLARPEMFAFACAAGLLWALERVAAAADRREARRFLLLAAALQWVWTNAHPSFPVGVGLAVAYAAGAWFRPSPRPLRDAPWLQVRWLALAAAACAGVTLLNPRGPALWAHPFQQMSASAFLRGVGEWKRLWSGDVGGPWRAAFVAAFALGLAAFAATAPAVDWPQAFAFAAAAWLPWSRARHAGLAAAILAPVVVCQTARALRGLRRGPPAWARRAAQTAFVLLCLGLAAVACRNGFYDPLRAARRFGFGVDPLQYPAAAADFVERAELRGRLVNNYDIGGYLMWRFGPRRKVFIDGRNMVYGEAFYIRYREALLNPEAWCRLLRRSGCEWIILRHESVDMDGPVRWLYRDRDWALCFADAAAVVFVKRRGPNAAVVRTSELHPQDAPAPALDALDWTRPPRRGDLESARVEAAWAGLYRKLGLYGRAAAHLARAVELGLRTPNALSDLGGLCLQLGRRRDAERLFRAALQRDPKLFSARKNLALLCELSGRHWEAVEQFLLALKQRPNDPSLHNNLANAYVKLGDLHSAMQHYRRALELAPAYLPPAYNLASLLISQRRYPEARAVCRELLRRNPRDATARLLLRRIPR